jgi:RNA polymerase sigma-70 factor (ECF subfamily)
MADPDKGFVERLFAEHRRALQAYFYRRVRKKSDVADLTQEAYLRMLRVASSEAIRNPQVYLYTVASNLVKEHAVLDQRDARHLDIDEASVQQRLGELPSLDSAIDAGRQAERLRAAVDQLPLNWRTAVVLQCRYGLTYQQIADHMGVSSSMVKKYLAQALTRCRRDLTR